MPARLAALAAVGSALLAAGCVERDTPAGTTTPPSAKTQASFIAVALVNNLADMPAVAVYTRPIRIDDPEAAKQGLEPPHRWALYQARLSRGNGYMMTPWAGRYAIAFAPVGQPVSKAVARTTFETKPGPPLIVMAAGSAGEGSARVIVRSKASRRLPGTPKSNLVRVWNLVTGGPPLNVDVMWDLPRNGCRGHADGWVRIATGARFGDTPVAALSPGAYRARVTAAGDRRRVIARGYLVAPAEWSVIGIGGPDGAAAPVIVQLNTSLGYAGTLPRCR